MAAILLAGLVGGANENRDDGAATQDAGTPVVSEGLQGVSAAGSARVAEHALPGPAFGEVLDEPTPSPRAILAPTPVPYMPIVPEGRAEVVCSVMPDCQKALRVALCESGPDYSAEFDGLHVGPFQIAVKYHADKFAAHGWDYYEDGNDPYRNSVIALEILNDASGYWGGPWPTCGWR